MAARDLYFLPLVAAGGLATLLLLTPVPLAAQESQPAAEPSAGPQAPAHPLADALQARLETDGGSQSGDAADARIIELYDFYEHRGYAPVWVDDRGVTKRARTFVDLLRAGHEDGLHPSDYHPDALTFGFGARTPEQLADLEVALSKTFFDYVQHMGAGRVRPNKVNREIVIYPEGPDPQIALEGAAQADDLKAFAASLAPQTPNYSRLKAALATFRAIDRAGGWTIVPDDEVLKPGMSQERVPILRTRMIEASDLKDGAHEGDVYDGALVEAVERFQFRHGLEVDGVVGRNTLNEINIPVSARVRQMELNMERRRWMKDDLGDYYVFVNLADQYLKVVSNDKTTHTARLVVGKTYHRTPVFSETMTYIDMNPYWNVPYSIAVNEYLPKLKRNPGALGSQNIRVFSGNAPISPHAVSWTSYSRGNFPFRLRQDPGPRNALGRIKFMFPNKYNIYIHDTPSKRLFSKAQRVFSHGCMRVQNPLDLAAELLGREGWDLARIERQINSGKKRIVKLTSPIPVHVTYLTAWVNKDGSVHFRRDVYGRDKRLDAALARVVAQAR